MEKQSALETSKATLRSAGVKYRLRMKGTFDKPRSPWLTLYHTTGTRAEFVIKGLGWQDEKGIFMATAHIVENDNKSIAALGPELIKLCRGRSGTQRFSYTLTWGSVRDIVKDAIAPGGEKEKDQSPFKPFKDRGHFGRMFDDNAVALTSDLEEWCLYTPESIEARAKDTNLPLIPRRYSSSVYGKCVEAVAWLLKKKVSIAIPELLIKLRDLKEVREDPAPDFIPRDADLKAWIQKAMAWDKQAGFIFAMAATYGLRPHEVWHITQLPGEVEAEPTMIQVGFVVKDKKKQATKTGHRFCKALPEDWLELFRLDDLKYTREMLAAIKSRWPTAGKNNTALGNVVSHLLYNSAKPNRCVPARLMGYYRPDPTTENPKPREKKGRSTAYDLRHRWALRCLEQAPHWSTELKAELMGHSAAIHTQTYLRSVSADQKLNRLQELINQSEAKRSVAPTKKAPKGVEVVSIKKAPKQEAKAEVKDSRSADMEKLLKEIEQLKKSNAKQKKMIEAASTPCDYANP